MQHGKNIYFTRVVVTLALLGHQTSHAQNKLSSLHNILFSPFGDLQLQYIGLFENSN